MTQIDNAGEKNIIGKSISVDILFFYKAGSNCRKVIWLIFC